jgi:hypothetical protein
MRVKCLSLTARGGFSGRSDFIRCRFERETIGRAIIVRRAPTDKAHAESVLPFAQRRYRLRFSEAIQAAILPRKRLPCMHNRFYRLTAPPARYKVGGSDGHWRVQSDNRSFPRDLIRRKNFCGLLPTCLSLRMDR